MKGLALQTILFMRKKGIQQPIIVIITFFLLMMIFLAVIPMVATGAETAERAATSCPDWMSKISDITDGVELC